MPTAAKLVAAVAFALVAYVSAELFKPAMSEGTQFGYFSPICAAIGLLVGWFVMGPLAGQGMGPSLGHGLRCSITIVFFALLGFSIYEMVLRSMKLRYDGPMEALIAALSLMLEYGLLMLTPPVLGALVIGGLAGGAAAEIAGKRWR